MEDSIKLGSMGIKLIPEWGEGIKVTDWKVGIVESSVISDGFNIADKYDVQIVASGELGNTKGSVEVFSKLLMGNLICIHDVAGCESGYTPDNINLANNVGCITSATTTSIPYTSNTVDEQFDLFIRGKNFSKYFDEHAALAGLIIRDETIGAQEVLLDRGIIPILTSSSLRDDSDLLITRTWQLANKCKEQSISIESENADNERIKRYLAKYTINPARAYGLADNVGSVEEGKLADLVLWQPAFFGVSPFKVIKNGIACTINNKHCPDNYDMSTTFMNGFSHLSSSNHNYKVIFASRSSIEQGVLSSYGLLSQFLPVTGARKVTVSELYGYPKNIGKFKIKVDPMTYQVSIFHKGEWSLITTKPTDRVPLAKLYNLF
jgi:urease subunit alpha